jgi:hypothetical protein
MTLAWFFVLGPVLIAFGMLNLVLNNTTDLWRPAHRRWRAGCCPKCGYQLKNRWPTKGCSECGWNRA